MLQEEQEDYFKSLKQKQKQQSTGKLNITEEEKMSDDEDVEVELDVQEEGDPMVSRAAFKTYMLKVMIDDGLDQKRAAKMEILDFLTLLNVLNKAGIHFK